MSALVLATSGGAWALTSYVTGHLGRLSAGTSGTPSSGPLNILVAGVDSRTGLTAQQQAELHVGHDVSTNSDTLMLVHVPADHSYVQVVSLPRDSWVNIPGHGMNKINAAIGLGGPKLMVSTVEAATGLAINDYVEVNFLGFVKVIDALGGVNICLPFAVDDAYSGLHLSAGVHHVDGITALEFARDRHSFAASDLARIDDQQQLMSTILSKAIEHRDAQRPVQAAAGDLVRDLGHPGGPGLQPGQPGQPAERHPAAGRGLHDRAAGQPELPDADRGVGRALGQRRGRPAVRPDPRRPAAGGRGPARAPAPRPGRARRPAPRRRPRPPPPLPTGAAAGGQEKTAAQDTCH